MALIDHIKALAESERYNLTTLAKAYNERYGTSFSQSSFHRKIRENNLKYTEYMNILNLLGYTVELKKK